ncbi:hypothetical protein [Microbacterium imperiale]|uniref:Uncharacterized protein n=1 Tax=Microbacterium imperiale TaxID=33884 RepID=A0A9W6HDP3_9MICO|nr:hypothetical protein [Microbacterium imperiale]MBP2419987.1 hypothetical protein [Microbacterium imperiale]MDS0198149.1 hypothetical protein [Microbacterium imperiale]BFE40329.1 hypothetical protein GCM10017544_12850 [Microbacterium imperiale]GLJ78695.1 hypothetical protein GCM10017586_03770 [Microbacterium imperiale]
MADIVGYIPPLLLVDTDSGRRLINTEAQVFAMTDTQFSSPLPITDMQGVPFTGGVLTSNSDGVLPEFRPPVGTVQVLIRAGAAVTPVTDISLYAEASVDAAADASEAAAAAQQDRIRASEASERAIAAADVLRELAEHQGAPLIEDPTEPGTFTILNTAAIREDPAEPGTFLMGAPE